MPTRGPGLVEEVIAAVAAAGRLPIGHLQDPPSTSEPAPLAPARLGAMVLPDGRALPPSLRRWLAFDAVLLGLQMAGDRLAATSLTGLVRDAFGDEHAATVRGVEERLLPGDCIPLPTPTVCPDDCRVFLYAGGEPDATGDRPVLGIDFSDSGVIGVFACGFDVYLARVAGLLTATAALGASPPGYEEDHATSEAVLGGRSILDVDDEA